MTANWKVVSTAALLLGLALTTVSPAAAADEPAAPPACESHRFFDSLNVVLIGIEAGALLADGATTQYALRHYGGRETDPLARPFVSAGWPGQIAGGTMLVSAEVGIRYLLHKHHHHRLERVIPWLVIGYGAAGAIHNAHAMAEASRSR